MFDNCNYNITKCNLDLNQTKAKFAKRKEDTLYHFILEDYQRIVPFMKCHLKVFFFFNRM